MIKFFIISIAVLIVVGEFLAFLYWLRRQPKYQDDAGTPVGE